MLLYIAYPKQLLKISRMVHAKKKPIESHTALANQAEQTFWQTLIVDWQTARKIYNNAKLANNYATWPYKDVLKNRITQAQNNVTAFNAEPDNPQPKDTVIMFNSRFSCMVCHQEARQQ